MCLGLRARERCGLRLIDCYSEDRFFRMLLTFNASSVTKKLCDTRVGWRTFASAAAILPGMSVSAAN